MFHALGLLAVTLGTATAAVWAADRWVGRIRARIGILLVLAPFLLVGKALVTGGVWAPIDIPFLANPLAAHAAEVGIGAPRNPILSDVVQQEIPWRKAVREAVKNGRLPLWNRFLLAGEPLLATQQPAVLHPATWIGFLLPLPQAWTFEMAMRFFLALICAFLFLRELECGEISSFLGASAWAFSDYLVFFAGYPLTPAAAPLPLLLLGLRRLARRPDSGGAALATAALLLIVTAGHPETLLHCVAAAGVYFAFELWWAPRGRRPRAVLLALLAGAATLGISAVILLPFAEALPHTQEHFFRHSYYAHVRRSVPFREALRHLVESVVPYAYGVWGKGDVLPGAGGASAYAGSVLWPLAALGFFSRRREKWPILLLGILGILAGARFAGITEALAKLPFFEIAINERLIFLGAFATAVLAAFGADELARVPWALAASAGLAAVAVAAIAYHVSWIPISRGMPAEYFRSRVLLQILPLLLIAALGLALARARLVGPAAVLVTVLFLLQRGAEERDVYPTYPDRAFAPSLESIAAIPRGGPQRFAALSYTFIPNVSAMYELEDVRGYEAMTFRPLFDTYPFWCVPQDVWYNRVDDPTAPFLSFLNVRHVLAPRRFSPPPGWPVLYSGREGLLLENPGALERAFVPRLVRRVADPTQRLALLAQIRDFGERGVLGEGTLAPTESQGWVPNGRAEVRIVRYRPQRLVLEVSAEQPAIVGTSVMAWPGWKVVVNGKEARLESYNHACHAFRVPQGRHTVELFYRPDGFVGGLAVSALSVAACGVAVGLRRRRRRPNPGR